MCELSLIFRLTLKKLTVKMCMSVNFAWKNPFQSNIASFLPIHQLFISQLCIVDFFCSSIFTAYFWMIRLQVNIMYSYILYICNSAWYPLPCTFSPCHYSLTLSSLPVYSALNIWLPFPPSLPLLPLFPSIAHHNIISVASGSFGSYGVITPC